jgi:curved DNA-binding protein CbpA
MNLYDLLGVRPDDDAEAIKGAFRKAAKANHPDHHGGDPQAAARFRQISLANEILRDTELRAAYDRLLESEPTPLRHKLKRPRSDVKRPVVRRMMTGALFTIMLAVGCKLYARNPEMPSDETAGVVARQSAPAAVRTAEGDKPEAVAAAQMPSVPLATPAAPPADAPAANDHDQEENTNGESASNPAGQPIAVASRDSKSDIHAGVPAKTEGGPPVPQRAPSPGAQSTKMPARARASAARHAPSRQPSTQAAPATPLEEFARQQERRNAEEVEEFKRLRWCETGFC